MNFDFSDVFTDYDCVCKNADKLALCGRLSGGILVLVRKTLAQHIKWSKIADNTIFILFDKCLFDLDADLLYSCTYIHPDGSSWYNKLNACCRNGIRIFQEKLLEIISDLPDIYLLCGGDFNARTGTNPDFVDDDIILHAESNEHTMYDSVLDNSDLERFSCDKIVNHFGRCLLDMCSILNIHIVNGRCGSDSNIGQHTFIGANGICVIDYVLASTRIFDIIQSFDIPSRAESSHLPLTLKLYAHHSYERKQNETKTNNKSFKFVWEMDKLTDFRNNLLTDEIHDLFEKSMDVVFTDINKSVDLIVDALSLAASDMKKQVKLSPRAGNTNKWFNSECDYLKKERCKLLNVFRKQKTNESFKNYHRSRN